jgi:cytochrome c5
VTWYVKLAIVAAILAVVWLQGRHAGSSGVQERWDAQVRADKDAADAAREADRLRSHAAATQYEAQRAAIARRATSPSPESVYALHATICPPAGALGKPLELGDVPIPAVWLDRLRDAGRDY